MTTNRWRWGAILVASAGLCACASSGGAAPVVSASTSGAAGTTAPATSAASVVGPTTTSTLAVSPQGLAATLEQYRADQVTHLLQIQVNNRSGRDVRLAGLRLEWPGLATVAPSTRADLVAAGQVVDLPVDYGDAVCATPPRGDESPPIGTPAVVVGTARWDDAGEPEAVRIPVTDVRGVLARLFVPSCRRQSVTGVVELSWSSDWTDATSPAGRLVGRGTLRLHRRSGTQAVRVVALRGSVVLSVDPAPEAAGPTPLLTLAGDQTDATLAVLIGQTGSCADHVLGQSSQTFLLPVTVTVGDGPETAIDVVPDTHAQDQLLSIASRACGN